MLNMVKLDWLGMKCYQKRILIIPVFICLYGFIDVRIIVPTITFMMLSFSVNPFAVEEKGKLDNLYLTLPVTRKTIVNARFVLSFIMTSAGLVFGMILTALLSALLYGRTVLFSPHTFKADFASMFLLVCMSLLCYAIMNLSTFPVLFKIGYAKGKLLGFIFPIIGMSIAAVTLYLLWHMNGGFRLWLIEAVDWAFANTVWAAAMMLAAAAVFLAGSYVLSYKVYAKREF